MKTPRILTLPLLAAVLAALTTPARADLVLRVPEQFTLPVLAPSAPAEPLAPRLVLTSVNLDFGSVAVTDTGTTTVTLANTGTAPGAVGIAEPTAPFSLAHDCPAELAPAAACTLTFTFAPTEYGSASGAVTVAGQSLDLGGFGDITLISQVVTNGQRTLVKKTDGTLWATGQNGYGQLGLGDTTNRTSFTQVTSMGKATASIAVGLYHTLVLKTDGTLWAAGYNQSGQLGLGDTANRTSFTQVTSMGTAAASIAAGGGHTLVKKTDGTLWAAGQNGYGRLGLGDTANRTSFTQVTSMGTATASVAAGDSHTLVLKTDGTLWAAGYNGYGQLGLGGYADRSSFTQVTSIGTEAAFVAAGNNYTMVVKKTDGTLWATGANNRGQLGLGNTTDRLSLTQVTSMGAATASIAAGEYHTLVLKTDGTLWAAGDNFLGQLGDGTTTSKTNFVQVASMGTATASVAAGQYHTLVLKTDGKLWAIGYNNFGQLGLGNTANRSSFTLVP